MFSKKTKALSLCICLSLVLFGSVDVFAKGVSGGRSGGFSSPRASSSAFKASGATQAKSTYTASASAAGANASSNFFSQKSTSPSSNTGSTNFFTSTKPTTKAASVNGTVLPQRQGFAGTSVFDKNQAVVIKQEKAIKAKEAFVTSANKYTSYKPKVYSTKAELPTTVTNNPLFSTAKVKSTSNYSTFEANKNNYYKERNWAPRPYMYSHSSYGGYDGLMFWMMLDSMSDMAMMSALYNHSGQEGFNQWKAEAEKLAKSDENIAKQLAEMNTKLSTMTGEKDPTKLPEGMTAEVALASDALVVADKDKVTFNVATGQEGGIYCKGGNILKKDAEDTIAVSNINTAGTMENIKLFVQKKVDGFIGQKDGIDSYALSNPNMVKVMKNTWVSLYREPVFLIANRNGNVKSIEDITEKHTIYIGMAGSGTENVWNRFVRENRSYRAAKTVTATSAEALDVVLKDPNTVMLSASGINSDFIKAVDKVAADKLRLVPIDDNAVLKAKDAEGEPLYTSVKIPSGTFPNLQKGWFFSKSIKTVATDAVFVVSDEWVEKNGKEAFTDLTAAITSMQPKLYEAANGPLQ